MAKSVMSNQHCDAKTMEIFCENSTKYLGLLWSRLLEDRSKSVKQEPPDNQQTDEKPSCSASKTMKLPVKDRRTFGVCPALDECYLSVCDECGAVLKPQALSSHIERRHRSSSASAESSIRHLMTSSAPSKPSKASRSNVPKSSKLKNSPKDSPRSSPKSIATAVSPLPISTLAVTSATSIVTQESSVITSAVTAQTRTTTETFSDSVNLGLDLLEKYQLPKQPSNQNLNVAKPKNIDKTHSALAKRLSEPSWPSEGQVTTTSINMHPPDFLTRSQPVEHSGNISATKKRPLEPSETASRLEPPSKFNTNTKTKLKVGIPKLTIKKMHTSGHGTTLTVSHKDFSHNLDVRSRSRPTTPCSATSSTAGLSSAVTTPSKKLIFPTTTDKNIPCKDREYDPDRHCGCMLEGELGKHCTRSLTCKTHALSLRRKVAGRSKSFDQLLQEHREAKEALQLAKAASQKDSDGPGSMKSPASIGCRSPVYQHPDTDTTRFHEDIEMEGPDHTALRLGSTSEQTPNPDHPLSPFTSTINHPRPLGVCSYGMRVCGSSLVSGRQLDYLRLALRYSLEQPSHLKRSASHPNSIRKPSAKKRKSSTATRPESRSSDPSLSMSMQQSDPVTPIKSEATIGSRLQSSLTTGAGSITSQPQSAGAQFVTAKMLQEMSTGSGNVATLAQSGSAGALLQSLRGPQIRLPGTLHHTGGEPGHQAGSTLLLSDMSSNTQKLLQTAKGATIHLTSIPPTGTVQLGPPANRRPVKPIPSDQESLSSTNGLAYHPSTPVDKLTRAPTAYLGIMSSQSNGLTNTSGQIHYMKANGLVDSNRPRDLAHPSNGSHSRLADTHQVLAMQIQQPTKNMSRTLPIIGSNQRRSQSPMVANIVSYNTSS